MKRFFVACHSLVALLVLLAPGATKASNSSTQLKHGVALPGGVSSGTNVVLRDVIGESVVGSSSGAAAVHHAGYLRVAGAAQGTVAVVFAAFDVDVLPRGVELSWAVSGHSNLLGFHVYRAPGDGPFARINTGLIAPAGRFYTDDNVAPGNRYRYRVGGVDGDGEFVSPALTVSIPDWQAELRQNHPNPFNPATTISFYLPDTRRVTLRVFDAGGRLVRTLADGERGPGDHALVWDGADNRGTPVSSGVYFYRMRAGRDVFTKKLTIVK